MGWQPASFFPVQPPHVPRASSFRNPHTEFTNPTFSLKHLPSLVFPSLSNPFVAPIPSLGGSKHDQHSAWVESTQLPLQLHFYSFNIPKHHVGSQAEQGRKGRHGFYLQTHRHDKYNNPIVSRLFVIGVLSLYKTPHQNQKNQPNPRLRLTSH